MLNRLYILVKTYVSVLCRQVCTASYPKDSWHNFQWGDHFVRFLASRCCHIWWCTSPLDAQIPGQGKSQVKLRTISFLFLGLTNSRDKHELVLSKRSLVYLYEKVRWVLVLLISFLSGANGASVKTEWRHRNILFL